MAVPDVALVAPYPPPDEVHGGASGVASYTANLAHSLVEEGARVTVVAPREPGLPASFNDGGVAVTRVFDRGAWAVPAAARAALTTGAPVVHLQHEAFLFGGPSAMPGLLGALAWMRAKIPTLVTMHQVVDPASIDASFTRLHRVAVPSQVARAGVTALQRGIPRLVSATLVLEDRFRSVVPRSLFVPHGVEAAPDVDPAAGRSLAGVGESLLALCFGYLAPYKGLELALDAARVLAQGSDTAVGAGASVGPDSAGGPGASVGPDARTVSVVIAGGGHPRLDGRDDYAAGLASAYEDAATFTGYVADTDVHPLFAAADVVLVLYPRPFSSSGVLALALAHHRPVLLSAPVAHTLGAPAELVVSDDPAALAARLSDLARRPAERNRLAAVSAGLAVSRSWPEVARRHLQIYEEVRRGESPAAEPVSVSPASA